MRLCGIAIRLAGCVVVLVFVLIIVVGKSGSGVDRLYYR
jgi:hypothetical protein